MIRIRTHAPDCKFEKESLPEDCVCEDTFDSYEDLAEVLKAGFFFECATCGTLIDAKMKVGSQDRLGLGSADAYRRLQPVATISPCGDLGWVYCCPQCKGSKETALA